MKYLNLNFSRESLVIQVMQGLLEQMGQMEKMATQDPRDHQAYLELL